MTSEHANQVVLITGAGRGLGKGTALAFGAAGAKVAIADLVVERAAATAAEITGAGGTAMGLACDVRDEASVQAMVAAVAGAYGKVDVLANIAGGYVKTFRASHETPEDEWDLVLDSNLKGSFFCAKAVIPHMLRQGGGRIINFASNAGRTSSPVLGVAYTAAKTGVLGLTRHLAKEYARNNILVNTIAPGPAKGERGEDTLTEAMKRDLVSQIPLGRFSEPRDLAGVVMFLASDAARFITGATIDVNGGYVMV